MSTTKDRAIKRRLRTILNDLEGAVARTQELQRQLLERLRPVEQSIDNIERIYHAIEESSHYYVARETGKGMMFASWSKPGALRWTPRLDRATGFRSAESARVAAERLRPPKGQAVRTLRVLGR